jgi:5,10-methylenetetrahydromethanopterin reductase
MEFGFGHVPSEHYQRHVNLVKKAEDLGYDFAWIPDQTYFHDPYVIMSVMALATQRIKLGVGVTNPYTRHPSMSVRSIVSVDEVSNGRAHLGIGAGNRKELLNPLGLDSSHAGEKCLEMAELVRALLEGRTEGYNGKHYQAHGVKLEINARANLPIYIAGRGARVLQAAGEVADGMIIGGLCTAKGINYAIEQARIGTARSGRDINSLEVVSWVTCQLIRDRSLALEKIRPVVAHIVGGAPMEVLEAIELKPSVVSAIKEAYSKQGILEAANYVTVEAIDAFTIIGDVGQVVERILGLQNAGVSQLSMLMPPGSVIEHEHRLRQFSEEIFPHFK